MSQFTAERFARGVKLTIQHVNTPLDEIAREALNANIEGISETLVPTVVSYTIPIVDAQCDSTAEPNIAGMLPLIAPPFQEQFDRTNLQVPDYPVILSSVSLSIDNRASQYAIVGVATAQPPYNSTTDPGCLSAVDMGARYSMTVRLLEKTPWILSGDTTQTSEVLKIEVDGSTTFALGNDAILLQDLSVRLQPYKTYWWEVSTPGLKPTNDATEDALCFVSWTMAATLLSPLTTRDQIDFPIQNMPVDHGGAATGTTITYSPAVAGQPITGDDVQAELNAFDATLRDRLKAGYAVGTGTLANTPMAAAPFPNEALPKDSALQIIAVPLFSGLMVPSVQAQDITSVGTSVLPYLAALQLGYTYDRAFLRVPDNFVIHHAFASISYYSTRSTWPDHTAGAYAGFGTRSTTAKYVQSIGVVLSTWLQSDFYAEQQVAYMSTVGGNPLNIVDRIDINLRQGVNLKVDGYDLVELPLSWDASRTDTSWVDSGPPFFVGTSSNKTQARSDCGQMPFIFTPGPNGTPATKGQERILEVRWRKEDMTNGLDDAGHPTDTRVGQFGDWVILVGKQTLGA